jgi:hypothetical protein
MYDVTYARVGDAFRLAPPIWMMSAGRGKDTGYVLETRVPMRFKHNSELVISNCEWLIMKVRCSLASPTSEPPGIGLIQWSGMKSTGSSDPCDARRVYKKSSPKHMCSRHPYVQAVFSCLLKGWRWVSSRLYTLATVVNVNINVFISV